MSVALWPLLHKDIQISSLELKQPKIELVRNARGVWNYDSLTHSPQPAASSQTPGPRAPQQQQPSTSSSGQPAGQTAEGQTGSSSQAFSLQDLKIIDGQMALTDYQKKQPRTVYDHIDLRLVGYAPDRAFDLEAAAHLPGKGAQLIKLEGKAGPINNAQSANTPFDGSLEFSEVSLSGLQKFLNSASLENTDAVISGKADLRSQAGKFDSAGSLKLDQPRVHGHDLGYPISADYKVSDDLNADKLKIEKGDLKLGNTPVAITGMMDMKPTPSQIDLKINAANVSIAEVAQLAADFGTAKTCALR